MSKPFEIIKHSTDDQKRPIVDIAGLILSNADSIKLRDELNQLLPAAKQPENQLLIACKRLLDLAADSAGGTYTLKEVFGYPTDHRQPQLEGAALLLAMTHANNNQPYKPS